jgi:hypothetical protein
MSAICIFVMKVFLLYTVHIFLVDPLQDGPSRKWSAGGKGALALGNGHSAREVQF